MNYTGKIKVQIKENGKTKLVKVMSVDEFRKEKNLNTSQALGYAMKNDKIDFIRYGHSTTLILMTNKSKKYQPKSDSRRKG